MLYSDCCITTSYNLHAQDQPWSAQDERQIRGRVHRQPQPHTVYSYHILAKDTADMILCSQARAKKDMMEAFLSEKTGQREFISRFVFSIQIFTHVYVLELYDLLAGKTVVDDDDEIINDEDEEQVLPNSAAQKKKNSKRKKSPINNAAAVDDEIVNDKDEEQVLPNSAAQKKKNSKRKKSPINNAAAVDNEIVNDEDEEQVLPNSAAQKKNSKRKKSPINNAAAVDDEERDVGHRSSAVSASAACPAPPVVSEPTTRLGLTSCSAPPAVPASTTHPASVSRPASASAPASTTHPASAARIASSRSTRPTPSAVDDDDNDNDDLYHQGASPLRPSPRMAQTSEEEEDLGPPPRQPQDDDDDSDDMGPSPPSPPHRQPQDDNDDSDGMDPPPRRPRDDSWLVGQQGFSDETCNQLGALRLQSFGDKSFNSNADTSLPDSSDAASLPDSSSSRMNVDDGNPYFTVLYVALTAII